MDCVCVITECHVWDSHTTVTFMQVPRYHSFAIGIEYQTQSIPSNRQTTEQSKETQNRINHQMENNTEI